MGTALPSLPDPVATNMTTGFSSGDEETNTNPLPLVTANIKNTA